MVPSKSKLCVSFGFSCMVPSKSELRVSFGLSYMIDECKTHLCFEFISHTILCILYPYSCKTHKFPLNLVL